MNGMVELNVRPITLRADADDFGTEDADLDEEEDVDDDDEASEDDDLEEESGGKEE